MNTLKYKDYWATVEYVPEEQILHGRVEGINDLITFEAVRADEVEDAFHEAVDDYLAFCEEIGKTPQKTYSGSFNVRLGEALHRKLGMIAASQHTTLNHVVVQACQNYVAQA